MRSGVFWRACYFLRSPRVYAGNVKGSLLVYPVYYLRRSAEAIAVDIELSCRGEAMLHKRGLSRTREQTQPFARSSLMSSARRIQRTCSCGTPEGTQGQCTRCASKCRTPADGARSSVPAIVLDVLHSPGSSLAPDVTSYFSERFQHDLSQVRVHHDAQANRAADEVGARAYTVGRDVVFADGEYAPNTTAGRKLLAHELTHVVQQDGAQAKSVDDALTVGLAGDSYEREADAVANTVARAEAPKVSPKSASGLRLARAGWGEIFDAVIGVGPFDAYRARQIANEALAAAQRTGLPGLHNGPADAWRHCYWNCRMTAVLGADQAETIANNHEAHGGGPANENAMDTFNNAVGRACGSANCDSCCQGKLDTGSLRVLDGTGGIVPSIATRRSSTTTPGYRRY